MTDLLEHESSEERASRWKAGLYAYAVSIAALALALSLMAPAARAGDSVAFHGKDGQDRPMSLRLFNKPCEGKPAQFIHEQHLPKFRAGSLLWGGQTLATCWIADRGYVHSVDESGDLMNPIPLKLFKDDTV